MAKEVTRGIFGTSEEVMAAVKRDEMRINKAIHDVLKQTEIDWVVNALEICGRMACQQFPEVTIDGLFSGVKFRQ